MPATLYIPDPRAFPLQFPPSRELGTTGPAGAAGDSGVASVADSTGLDDFNDYPIGAAPSLSGGSGWGGAAVITGGSIVERTISGSRTERRLALVGPGEFIRMMPWGSKWKRLVIGLLMRINGAATITAEFNFGVCSGTTAGFGAASTTNFIGATTRNGNGNQFTATAGSDQNYFVSTLRGLGTRVATSFTDSAGVSTSNGFALVEASRLINVLDIRRARYGVTANNYVCILKGPHSTAGTGQGGPEVDLDYGDLIQAVTIPDSGNTINAGWSDGIAGTATISHSETAGALDCIDVYWGHATVPLELAAVGVFKVC